jgi:hypothetical protein
LRKARAYMRHVFKGHRGWPEDRVTSLGMGEGGGKGHRERRIKYGIAFHSHLMNRDLRWGKTPETPKTPTKTEA